MIIRPATIDDAEALGHLHVASWRVAYRGLVPDDYLASLDPERRAQGWRDTLGQDDEGFTTVVAEADGEVAGFAIFGPDRGGEPGVGELAGLYVAPEFWRRGIGRALVEHAESELRARGYRTFVLWVFRDNDRARRFYEAVGYSPDGGRKTLSPGGRDLAVVRYRKRG